jgi:hypothetical protein
LENNWKELVSVLLKLSHILVSCLEEILSRVNWRSLFYCRFLEEKDNARPKEEHHATLEEHIEV